MDRGGLQFFHSVIWDKRNPGLGQRYRRQHEMLMVAHRTGGRIRWNDEAGQVPNVLPQMPPRVRAHPNEKPLALMRRIVHIHTLPGDTVLDPFTGSGTTGVAALGLGRKFIGIELDADYFAAACRRIAEAGRQTDFFAGPAARQGDLLGDAA